MSEDVTQLLYDDDDSDSIQIRSTDQNLFLSFPKWHFTGKCKYYNAKDIDMDDLPNFKKKIYGVLGILPGFHYHFLLLISEVTNIGFFIGHTVYKVKSVEIVRLSKSGGWYISPDDDYIETALTNHLSSSFLYFSPSVDMTRSLQERHIPIIGRKYFNSFAWNGAAARCIGDESIAKCFCPRAAYGFFDQHTVNVKNNEGELIDIKLSLVGRRSSRRGGVRYWRRGIDDDGWASNFVMSEFVVELLGNVYSFIQIRGSAPMVWKQTLNLKYKPHVEVAMPDRTMDACKIHFDKLTGHFGNICCVCLLDDSGIEKPLSQGLTMTLPECAGATMESVPPSMGGSSICRKSSESSDEEYSSLSKSRSSSELGDKAADIIDISTIKTVKTEEEDIVEEDEEEEEDEERISLKSSSSVSTHIVADITKPASKSHLQKTHVGDDKLGEDSTTSSTGIDSSAVQSDYGTFSASSQSTKKPTNKDTRPGHLHSTMATLAGQVPGERKGSVSFHFYDFHTECKGMKYENLCDMWWQIKPEVEKSGVFVAPLKRRKGVCGLEEGEDRQRRVQDSLSTKITRKMSTDDCSEEIDGAPLPKEDVEANHEGDIEDKSKILADSDAQILFEDDHQQLKQPSGSSSAQNEQEEDQQTADASTAVASASIGDIKKREISPPPSPSSSLSPSFSFSQSHPHTSSHTQKQCGVVRTNCLDCLDRTNVFQTLICSQVLRGILKMNDLLSVKDVKIWHKEVGRKKNKFVCSDPLSSLPRLKASFKQLWCDHGDYLARQYGGSNAMKRDYVQFGKRTRRGTILDGKYAVERYIKNNFSDGLKQDGIDLLHNRHAIGLHGLPYRTLNQGELQVARGTLKEDTTHSIQSALGASLLLSSVAGLVTGSSFSSMPMHLRLLVGCSVTVVVFIFLIFILIRGGEAFVNKPLIRPDLH
ncbi:hypothetical protein ADUPG1_010327 [Aduncisulcus paluster]|uniref:SAC domain-containing protein n=1 Tax=Aduncisulcus paluster TaxID=2918883 RepID=A0ABQ5JRN5_9EUKA|nr:hypothetical protein ADUPG1_010327 [Aduncisulcus paluster]